METSLLIVMLATAAVLLIAVLSTAVMVVRTVSRLISTGTTEDEELALKAHRLLTLGYLLSAIGVFYLTNSAAVGIIRPHTSTIALIFMAGISMNVICRQVITRRLMPKAIEKEMTGK